MEANATSTQTQSVQQQIDQMKSQISKCTYLDHQQSYERAVKLFAGNSTIIGALTPATTPPVFNCQLVDPNDSSSVASTFHPTTDQTGDAGIPGVLVATFPEQSVKALERVTNVIQLTLLVVAIVLLISSLVLILNAIRMAIFARREEVGVMKLVGATNWFIRIPFMLEGLVQGLAGALVAVAVVLGANIGVHALVTHYDVQAFSSFALPTHELVTTEVLVLAVGVIVGAAGSVFAVRRFLDV
jgi:cell division transport system permease protein